MAIGGGRLGGEGAQTMTGGGGLLVTASGGGFLATVSGGGLPATVIGGEGARMMTGDCTGGGGDWARPAGNEKADEGTSAWGEPTVDDFSSRAVPLVTCGRIQGQHKDEGPLEDAGKEKAGEAFDRTCAESLRHTKTYQKSPVAHYCAEHRAAMTR